MNSERSKDESGKTKKDYLNEAKKLLTLITTMDFETGSDMDNEDQETDSYNCSFIYLISTMWFQKWQDKTSYITLKDGLDIDESNITDDILPRLNEDLLSDDKPDNFLEAKTQEFEFCNQFVISPLVENGNVTYLTLEVWQVLVECYPDAIEIKRVAYKSRGLLHFELNLTPLSVYFFSQSQFKNFEDNEDEIVKEFRIQISKRFKVGDLKDFFSPFIKEIIPKKLLPFELKYKHIGIFAIDADQTIDDFSDKVKKTFENNRYKYDTIIDFDGEILIHDDSYIDKFSHMLNPGATLIVEVSTMSGFKINARNYIICKECDDLISGEPIICECGKVLP